MPDEAAGRERRELRPFGEQQHHVRVPGGLGERARVAEFGAGAPGVAEGGRVVHGDACPHAGKDLRHVQGRGVAHVIGSGLERGAQHTDRHIGQVPPGQLEGEVGGAGPAPQVDRVHLAQEADSGTGAQFAGPGHEGADVLGQAATAETESRPQEGPADARVGAEDLRQGVHVAPGGLADLCHRIDEGDLRGQERVGCRLGQLGGFQAGDDEGGAIGKRAGVHLPEDPLGPAGGDARDDPVRRQGVGDRAALTQELRVPGKLGGRARLREFGGEPPGGAHRHGGLADDQARPVQQRGQRRHAGIHLGQVSVITAGLLRGAGADEMHVTEFGGLAIGGGEPDPPGTEPFAQELFQAGLVNGQLPGIELVDLRAVGVHREDVEPEAGHAGGMGDAQVPCPEYGEAQPAAHHAPFPMAPNRSDLPHQR